VLREYDVVLDTLGGDSLERSFQILKPGGTVVSLVGPPDAAFARMRGMNFLMVSVLWFLSRKVHGLARKRGASYSFFLLLEPGGSQLEKIGELLESASIRPVIDRVLPFDQAMEALAYLEKGRAKGKVVLTMK
jgi:NADPH:quinone reductase-like Zn-dependent oxidoreductase